MIEMSEFVNVPESGLFPCRHVIDFAESNGLCPFEDTIPLSTKDFRAKWDDEGYEGEVFHEVANTSDPRIPASFIRGIRASAQMWGLKKGKVYYALRKGD